MKRFREVRWTGEVNWHNLNLKELGENIRFFMEGLGVEDYRIRIDSTMEPYENYPGNPELWIEYESEETEQEQADRLKEEQIIKDATKLGIAPYEARILHDLRERGKI